MSSYLDPGEWPDNVDLDPELETDDPEHDPKGIDPYLWTHPKAASISAEHKGDVCPQSGVPLRGDERVITIDGQRGVLWRVSPNEQPVPSYHPDCWGDRQAELNHTLTEYEQ